MAIAFGLCRQGEDIKGSVGPSWLPGLLQSPLSARHLSLRKEAACSEPKDNGEKMGRGWGRIC